MTVEDSQTGSMDADAATLAATDPVTTLQLEPVAFVSSPFKQKFAIPRQPNLVAAAEGKVVFEPAFSDPNVLRGIEQFSHVWLVFHFHGTADKGWSATVQPPRLGGRQRLGVFASRAPFRPNALGLSVVRNLGSGMEKGRLVLRVGGLDLLDGTPILDVKPYLPYADALPAATGGFTEQCAETPREIIFSGEALDALARHAADYPRLRELIVAVLGQDPRPAWRVRPGDDKQYGMTLYEFNIKWRMQVDGARVLSICED